MAKLVYVVHPLGGDVEENVKKVLKICKEIHTQDIIPITPYLITLQYLQDHVPEERVRGMKTNQVLLEKKAIDETWVFGHKISSGMREDILMSLKHGIPVVCKSQILEGGLKEITREFQGQRL